ncbi:MAG: rumA [Dehalococcoidia bacterium]|nr:rumA [Dehalococcoidia bacterium]
MCQRQFSSASIMWGQAHHRPWYSIMKRRWSTSPPVKIHTMLEEIADDPHLILASGSPRRQELLALLRVPFEVIASRWVEDETPGAGETPEGFAVRLAWQKAMAVASLHPQDLVLAADTIVVLNGGVLGKPKDAQAAAETLQDLRGKAHQVITGLFLARLSTGLQLASSDLTMVHFRHYTDQEIEAYVSAGDPMDKAGAYGIQHESFQPAERIEGCYFNVVGLPCCVVARLLLKARLDVMVPNFPAADACRKAECSLVA